MRMMLLTKKYYQRLVVFVLLVFGVKCKHGPKKLKTSSTGSINQKDALQHTTISAFKYLEKNTGSLSNLP